MPLDGLTAMTVILISTFAMDRLVTATLFLVGQLWDGFPDPEKASEDRRANTERKYKLFYYGLAIVLVAAVLGTLKGPRFMKAVGYEPVSVVGKDGKNLIGKDGKNVPDENANAVLDLIITGILIIGGSEKLNSVLKLSDGKKAAPAPIKPTPIVASVTRSDWHGYLVTGELKLDEKKNAAGDSPGI